MSKVRPATRRGLAGEAADRIREAIFDGVFPPGVAIKEVELANDLGISRGSVREGLSILEREGLVVSEWHRGTWVRSLSPTDVDELYTLRSALDGLAMRTAATVDADLSHLDAIVERMRTAGTAEELVTLDMRFHDGVYAAAGHQRLTEAWEAIRGQIHLFLLTRIQKHDETYMESMAPEHAGLVDALRRKDPDEAAARGQEHLRRAYDQLRR